MKNKWPLAGVVAMAFLLSACDNHKSYRAFLTDKMETVFESQDISQYDSIVIMPRVGCTSCIHKSESFLKKYIDNNKVLFVFTRIGNEKKLKIEIGNDILSRKNVVIDRNNAFVKSTYEESSYPILMERMPDGTFDYRLLPGVRKY